ncbi:MAG: hypothetical protein MMC33_010059, partial [Icmadophila ericetorum]|nr:hypothetical protein [Icmadophila ericetorum]
MNGGVTWQTESFGFPIPEPSDSTKLAALWHETGSQWDHNTLVIVYQTQNNTFQLGNQTEQGWEFSTIAGEPTEGTAISLCVLGQNGTENTFAAQLRL